jgi:hypothetical protein
LKEPFWARILMSDILYEGLSHLRNHHLCYPPRPLWNCVAAN